MNDGVTWYDVLGVLPTAPAHAIQQAYEDKARLLGQDRVCGAPPKSSPQQPARSVCSMTPGGC